MAFQQSVLIRGAFFLAFVVLVLAAVPWVLPLYEAAEEFLRLSGARGVFVYGLLMIGAILIAPIPASPLALLAGEVFGPWKGMLITLIAATMGAVLAFWIARVLLSDAARARLKLYRWYQRIEHLDERRVALAVALTRLMPQVSFDLISYAAGLTRIRTSWFALATFLGMIPIVFLFSFFGAWIGQYEELMLTVLVILFFVYALTWVMRQRKGEKNETKEKKNKKQ